MREKRRLQAALPALLVAVGIAGVSTLTASAAPAKSHAPHLKAAPTISGDAKVGSTLTANNGTWTNSPTNFTYLWHRCNKAGKSCSKVGNNQQYTLTTADAHHRMRATVTAHNSHGASTATTAPTGVVRAASGGGGGGHTGHKPHLVSPPSISGTLQQGQTLTASAGNWENGHISLAYRWLLCDSGGNNCNATGTTSQTYTLGAGDVGHALRIEVTASNGAGSTTATSNATAAVAAAPTSPPPSVPPGSPPGAIRLASGQLSIPVSSVALPERLIISNLEFLPARITSRSQPLVARFRITDTRGFAIRDALVYAVGVPFDRLSAPAEVATDQSGWAQITFQVKPTFALRRGNLVVVFVRARKPGDSVLAGVSARRLVAVRVG